MLLQHCTAFTHPRIIWTVLWKCEQKAMLLLANTLRHSHLNCLAVSSLAFALEVRFLLLCHEALWLRSTQTSHSFPSSTWVVFEAYRAPSLNLLSLCKVSFFVKWFIIRMSNGSQRKSYASQKHRLFIFFSSERVSHFDLYPDNTLSSL